VIAVTTKTSPAWFNAGIVLCPTGTVLMKIYRLGLTISIAALLTGSLAVAGEIYKWTDNDGNVHYEDRPTGDTQMERMDIVSRNTDNSVVQARVDARIKAKDAARQVASEAPPEMTPEELRAEQKDRQEKCQTYRDRLQAFLRSQRLYKEDDAGDRSYLSEVEVMEARTRVEGQIKEYCGS